MPLYEINLKDGTTLDVEAPAGATEAQIISLANQQFTPQALDRTRRMAELQALRSTPDVETLEDDEGFLDDITPDFLEELLKGTASGAAGILESGALGAATILPEREELAVRDGIQSLFDPVQEALSIDQDTGGFAAGTRKFGEGLGSFGGILGAAAINPALAVGLATTAGAGEASERARAGDATEEERTKASLLGFGVGATELISPLRILSVFKKGLGQDATVGLVGSLKRIAQEGGVEAAQEASAGIMQNLIEQGIYNPEQGTFEGAGEQALIGGGVGGFVQGLLELAVRGRIKTDPDGSQDVDLLSAPEEKPLLPTPEGGPTAPEGAAALEAQSEELRQLAASVEEVDAAAPEKTGTIEDIAADARAENAEKKAAARATAAARKKMEEDAAKEGVPADTAADEDIIEGTATEKDATVGETPVVPEVYVFDIKKTAKQTEEEFRTQFNFTTEQVLAGLKVREDLKAGKITSEEASNRFAGILEQASVLSKSDVPETEVRTGTAPVEETAPDADARNLEQAAEELRTAGFTPDQVTAGLKIGQDFKEGKITEEEAIKRLEKIRADALADAEAAPVEDAAPVEETAPDTEKKSFREVDAELRKVEQQRRRDGAEDAAPKLTFNKIGKADELAGKAKRLSVEGQPNIVLENRTGAAWRAFDTNDNNRQIISGHRLLADAKKALAATLAAREVVTPAPEAAPVADTAVTEAELKPVILTRTKDAKMGDMRARISSENAEYVIKDQPNIVVRNPIGRRWEAVDTNDNDKIIATSPNFQTLKEKLPKILATPAPEAAPAAAQETTTTPKGVTTPKLETPVDPFAASALRQVTKGVSRTGFDPSKLDTQPVEGKRTEAGAKKETVVSDTVKKGEVIATAKREAAPAIASQRAKKAAERAIKRQVTREDAKKAAPNAKKVADIVKGKNPRAEFLTKQDRQTRPNLKLAVNDVEKVADLVLKPQVGPQSKRAQEKSEAVSEGQTARHAYTYFTQASQNIADTIEIIAHDIVNSSKINKASGAASTSVEADYVRGTGRDNAKAAREWIRNNLSDRLNKDLDALIEEKQTELEISIRGGVDPATVGAELTLEQLKAKTPQELKAEKAKKEAAARKKRDRDIKEADRLANLRLRRTIDPADVRNMLTLEDVEDSNIFYLMSNTVVGLDVPTHPVVGKLLTQGKLPEALRAIALTTPSPRIEQIATALSRLTGDTKVKVNKFVTNPAGESAAGYFDPKTNTIVLNAETGINPHTILHEMAHAATSATIANKSHPLTKQLNTLFNNVKDKLDTAYGSQNLDEFVAETFGNPEFQRKLAGINVKGEPISSLRRFFNAVANFFRRKMNMQTKSVESALNETDKLLEAILAPSPETRDADILYSIQDNVLGHIKNMHQGFKAPTDTASKDKFLDRVTDFINGGAAATTKNVVMQALPFQAVTDLTKKYGSNLQEAARELQEAIEQQIGDTNKADGEVDGTLKTLEEWQKNNSEVTDVFNSVVYESTTNGVDPTDILKTDAKGKEYLEGVDPFLKTPKTKQPKKYKTTDPDKIAIWKGMQARWTKEPDKGGIGADGRKTYIKMRNAYQLIYRDLKAVVEGRVDDLVGDVTPEDKANFKKSVMEQIFDNEGIRPYFPLTRTGDIWIKYKASDGKSTENVYESFVTDTARARRIAELNQDPRVSDKVDNDGNVVRDKNGAAVKDMDLYDSADNITFSSPTPGSFVEQTLEILGKSKPAKGATKAEVDAHNEQVKEIMGLFIKTLPETSFAKSMQKRGGRDQKGELGFDRDAFEAFRSRAYDLTRQVQRIKYGNKIRGIDSKLTDALKANTYDNPTEARAARSVVNELLERSKFARNPPNTLLNRAAAQANRIAFLGTIGFNVSSAVVNASQIPLVMGPMLNGKYRKQLGIAASGKAIGKAMSLITGSGFNRKISEIDPKAANREVKGTPSIDNYYETIDGKLVVRKDLNLTDKKRKELERLTVLVQTAGDRGLLNRSLFYDTLGIDQTGRARSFYEKVNAWGALVFHVQESFNRQTALISAYDLEIQSREAKGEDINTEEVQQAAAQEALRMAQEMNGGAALATTGRFAQQGIGRVAMMYKGYGVQMYYTLFKTGDAALRSMKNSKKYTPEEIRAAREQFFGIALASALLAGVQGMPIVGGVLLMANLFLDDDEDDAETILRKHIGEFAYKGPVTALLGTDISSRIGLSNLLYRDNPYNAGASVPERVFEIAGGPAWSVASSYGRGMKDILSEDGNVERGIEAMLPAAVRNLVKGTPVIGRYARDKGILTRRGDPILDDVTTGGLIAQMIGFPPTDYTLAQEQNQAIKRIDRAVNTKRTKLLKRYYVGLRFGDDVSDVFNDIAKFNSRHPTAAITPSSIKRSLAGHMRSTIKMHNGVTLSPNMRMILQNHVAEYSQYGVFDD